MSTAKRLHYSYDDYLRLLEQSDIKLEYCDGAIYAVAGGSLAHGALSVAVAATLRQVLGGACTVFSSDVKVFVDATALAAFPDASVVCGTAETAPHDRHALTNPALLVEVTSPSTEDYDRGDKLSQYKQLPSLQAVLLVSHRARAITVVYRSGGGWEERELRGSEVVELSSPSLRFAVDDVYAGVQLEPQAR